MYYQLPSQYTIQSPPLLLLVPIKLHLTTNRTPSNSVVSTFRVHLGTGSSKIEHSIHPIAGTARGLTGFGDFSYCVQS